MRRRLRLAWRVLRGGTVVYRARVVLDGDRVLIGRHTAGSTLDVDEVDGSTDPADVGGRGEVVTLDFERGIAYPLILDGQAER